jgi:hypothetical protein
MKIVYTFGSQACYMPYPSYPPNKKNSVAFSRQANYIDWASATCRRNLVPTSVDRGVSHGQHGGSPTVVNLSFLDQSRYFYSSSPHLSSRGLSGPRSRPTATQNVSQHWESNPIRLGLQPGSLTTRPQRRSSYPPGFYNSNNALHAPHCTVYCHSWFLNPFDSKYCPRLSLYRYPGGEDDRMEPPQSLFAFVWLRR